MGSSAAFHLASRGLRVLGLDRFRPPHPEGSSHGESRVIREAYWEDPIYVPLVRRAYELWADLEKASGKNLFQQTGALFMGVPDGVMVPGCRRTAAAHNIRHRNLSVAEVRREFPQFRPTDDMIAFYEYRAGTLAPEACVEEHLRAAAKAGAELRYNEPLTAWSRDREGITLTTSEATYHADRAVFATGAWMGATLSELALPLTVERQVLFWFEPKIPRSEVQPDRFPIYAFEPVREKLWYGFPDLGRGCKLALHHQGEATTPESLRKTVEQTEINAMRELVGKYLPAFNGKLLRTEVCMYTNTPDFNYVIDFHPKDERIVVLSPCSGHGFKYASVVGEIAADLFTKGKSRFDLGLFKTSRFAKKPG